MVKRTLEGNNYRYRIRDPRLFKQNSFVTLDIGDKGKHKLVRGRLKKNNTFKTQSVTVEKEFDRELRSETNSIIRKAVRE